MASVNMNPDSDPAKIASLIAGSLNEKESTLLKLMSGPQDASSEKAIEAAKIEYQRAQRTMTLFSELMKNAHDMMMSLIRNMKLN